MRMILRGRSGDVEIAPWGVWHAGWPIRFHDELEALAFLRAFKDGDQVARLRAFLATMLDRPPLVRQTDDEVILEVARRLAGGTLVALSLGAQRVGAPNDPDRDEDDAAPASAEPARLEEKTWIEIVLVDEEDQPVPGTRYMIELVDGTKVEGRLDSKGFARVDGIDPGTCVVHFPDLDEEAWKRA